MRAINKGSLSTMPQARLGIPDRRRVYGKQGSQVTLARLLEPYPVEWATQPDHWGQIYASATSTPTCHF